MRTTASPTPGSAPCVQAPFSRFSQRTNTCSQIARTNLTPRLDSLQASGFGFGATVTQAGVFMAPSALMMLFAGPLAGWLGSRYGSRLPLLIGTAVGSASFVLLLLTYDSRLGIYFASAALGLGIGFAFASMATSWWRPCIRAAPGWRPG